MKFKTVIILGMIYIGIMMFVIACRKDFNKISADGWSPDLATPFIKTSFTLDNLIGTGSTFEYTDDSLLIFYYQSDSFINITVDTLMKFTDMATNSEFSLQAVKIDDFELNASFDLGDVLSQIDSDVADFLQQHDGEEVVIPPFGMDEPFNVELPSTDIYNYLKFSDGYLSLQITNTLSFDLNNINYRIWDVVNNQLLDQFSVDVLAPQDIAFDTIWLKGKTLSNQFKIIVNSFEVNGTYPDSVMLNLSNGLEFVLQTHNLEVVGGEATIDQQLNYTDDLFVDLNFDEAKITKVKFESGILNYTFTNTFGIGVKIILELTSANINGEVPVKEFQLPINGEFTGSWDLGGMEIDLTTDTLQPYNRFPVSLQVILLTMPDPVAFDTSQKVNIDFNTDNIMLGYIEGDIGRQITDVIGDTVNLDISFFQNIEGDIYFDETELALSYSNSFGIPVLINTDFIGLKESTGEEMNLGVDSIIIDCPQIPGEEVNKKIVFNKDNTNIVNFLNFRPEKIVYSGNAETNWNGDTTNFLLYSSKLVASLEFKIPMVFRTSSLVFRDTVGINFDLDEPEINKGKFYFDITNGFPFNIQLNLRIPDSATGRVIDSLSVGMIPSAEVDANGKVVERKHKLVIAAFDDNFIANLKKADKVYFEGQLITAGGGVVPVGLYADYQMDIKVSIQLQISP